MVIFKMIGQYKANVLLSIIINYMVAGSLGWFLAYDQWASLKQDIFNWLPFALGIGTLFISLFQLMARSVHFNGMALTTVATKLSVLIPVILASFIYQESLSLLQIIGLVLGLIAVWFISKPKPGIQINLIWILAIFLGSGLLDALLNHTVQRLIQDGSQVLFTSILFSIAGIIGLLISPIYIRKSKSTWGKKELLAGLILGIPNYGSIYFLLKAIAGAGLSSVIVFPINNVGIVLFSALVGWLVFREKLSLPQWIGIGLALICILLMSVT